MEVAGDKTQREEHQSIEDVDFLCLSLPKFLSFFSLSVQHDSPCPWDKYFASEECSAAYDAIEGQVTSAEQFQDFVGCDS